MPHSRDPAFLSDMLTAARGILRSLQGRSLADYQRDEDFRLVTERRLEIIGEAARRLSDELRALHPGIPWRRVIGLRNVLAHQYDEVDDVEVWRLVNENLPRLVEWLESVLPSPPPDPEPEP